MREGEGIACERCTPLGLGMYRNIGSVLECGYE